MRTAVAPNASAFNTSVPRLTPLSISTGMRPATLAVTTSNANRSKSNHPTLVQCRARKQETVSLVSRLLTRAALYQCTNVGWFDLVVERRGTWSRLAHLTYRYTRLYRKTLPPLGSVKDNSSPVIFTARILEGSPARSSCTRPSSMNL